MLLSFFSSPSNSERLHRRKGGGRNGSGRSSAGKNRPSETPASIPQSKGRPSPSATAKGPSGTSTPAPGKVTPVPLHNPTANGQTAAVAYGPGGGNTIVIPNGRMFSGRTAGGGTRNEIYGTRTYGSGYPGIIGRGSIGRGFPFWYWPIVWMGDGVPNGSYLQAPEYGNSLNTSRVGGPMAEATFISNSANTTFHVLSDNSTVSSLISSIDTNCSSSLSPLSSTSPQVYDASAPGAPQPEQSIQYYRASSIVLTLDGYNNSATLSSNPNATDSPLPLGIDTTLLNCLNQTIGLSAPLVSSAALRWSMDASGMLLLGLVWWVLSL